MRICVAGADCFIGVPLVRALANAGNNVVAVIRNESFNKGLFNNNSNIESIPLDFAEYKDLRRAIGKVDCLVVLTWIGTRGKARLDSIMQKKNYETIKKAVIGVVKNGCKKVLTAGSQAEYGLTIGKINEHTACNPNTEYGKYKLALFNTLADYCKKNGVDYIEPRFFSLYGPGDFSGTLIMSTIEKMKRNERCDFTESTQMWDYLYVDDAVDAVVGLCLKKCKNGSYILGSGDRRPLKNYIFELKKTLNSESELVFGSVPYGQEGVVTIEPDITKIQKEIGWEPRHSFEEGIKELLNTLF